MELQQCWSHYLKADQLLEQGHWPEAHYLFEQVLTHLPEHIHSALNNQETKPCQFTCLVTGIRDAAVAQSHILNRMGQYEQAFNTLNQTYALLQFVSLEGSDLIRTIGCILIKHCDDLLQHMAAFCSSQRNARWMLELETVQKAHHHFDALKQSYHGKQNTALIN